LPCPAVKALGLHVKLSVMYLRCQVQISARVRSLSTKGFLITVMQIINREIIPGRKGGFDGVLYDL